MKSKPFTISKYLVLESYKKVKARKGGWLDKIALAPHKYARHNNCSIAMIKTRTHHWMVYMLAVFFVFASNTGRAQSIKFFDLTQVRLEKGPFLEAQQADLHYILSLDVDRLLVPFLREAGLTPKAESYGNWENTGLDGHIGGHYLSALSLMYAATGDAEVKRRLDYMIDQLADCQKRNGNGYIGGIPNGKLMWEEIRQGKIEADNFSLNHRWVPLYNIHKLFTGLYDAAIIGKNPKAKDVFVKLCDWLVELTSSRSDDQIQVMLKSEHGGMNEVLALAFELTHEQKYLDLAERFSHRAILDPLIRKSDQLTGLHANTQIPKVIGFKKIADLSNNKSWAEAAEFFWQTVVDHRTVSIGGNSVREHFHPANDFSSMIESNQGPETCNTYNMLKLTKALYQSAPDARYLDYYERAMYNHILSSQHPAGGFVYFTPMRPRHYRVYSSVNESFWCCVGSGLENHGKYGELIYAHDENDLYVNLFVSSSLRWNDKGLVLKQETDFPFREATELKLQLKTTSKFNVKLRHPAWIPSGEMKVMVNGKMQKISSAPSTYLTISREWKDGDVITIALPMHTRVEYLPDGSAWGSFIHGPVVLAAITDSTDLKGLRADGSRMGHVAEGKFYPIDEAPMIIKKNDDVTSSVKSVHGKPMTFKLDDIIYPDKFKGLTLVPFFTIHDARYIVYWQVASPEKLTTSQKDFQQRDKMLHELKSRIVDEVVLGEQQPEVDHAFRGEKAEAGNINGKTWRSTSAWFSCELQNPEKAGSIIWISYSSTGPPSKFDVLVNDVELKPLISDEQSSSEIISVRYKVPDQILDGPSGTRLTVKCVAHPGYQTARVFSLHLLKR